MNRIAKNNLAIIANKNLVGKGLVRELQSLIKKVDEDDKNISTDKSALDTAGQKNK